MGHDAVLVNRILGEAREDVRRELGRLFEERRRSGYGPLYDLLADYPFREGKGLRPGICFAACRAAGGGRSTPWSAPRRSSCSTTRFSCTTTSRTARASAADG